jgi:hypothetical protein
VLLQPAPEHFQPDCARPKMLYPLVDRMIHTLSTFR